MIEMFYNIELVVGVVLGVAILVFVVILDSEYRRQERELSVSQERNDY